MQLLWSSTFQAMTMLVFVHIQRLGVKAASPDLLKLPTFSQNAINNTVVFNPVAKEKDNYSLPVSVGDQGSSDSENKHEENITEKKPYWAVQKARLDMRTQDYDRCSSKLYSCQGRCNSAPRLACSCHVTCSIYGNCCEDFEDFCPSLQLKSSEIYYPFLGVDVRCIGNNVLISSCVQGIEINVKNVEIERGGVQDMEQIVHRCLREESDDPLLQAPVSDVATRLQFKNIFCAVCNGVQNVEFWTGVTHCKYNGSTNSSARSDANSQVFQNKDTADKEEGVTGLRIEDLLSSKTCQQFWRPQEDNPNLCLHGGQIKSKPLPAKGLGGSLERTGSAFGEEPVIEAEDTYYNITEKIQSLHLEWRNVNGSYDDIFNQNFLEERCRNLNSFVEHPFDIGTKYKNKYCYILDDTSMYAITLCEPSLKISDDGGVWYSLILKAFGGIEYDVQSKGIPADDWDIYRGIEENVWDDLVTDSSLSRCDSKTALIIEGRCRSKSFFLTTETNFTFIRSSLIRGNFNDQVDKYTSVLVDTFVDKVSNRTRCVVVSMNQSKVAGSSVRFQSRIEFQCLDILDSDSDILPVTPATLTGGGSISNEEINHYIMFVSNTLKLAMEREKTVTLPVTIELSPCIFPDSEPTTKVRGYCTTMKSVWKAVRKVDNVIGNLSLEGFITIICCVLSVLGLIIRLALQNVVPFYKSYPGKIQFGLCLSLFVAYTLFLLGGLVVEGSTTCMVMGVLTHVAFLSALFWMNVTAFEIWRTFRTWRNQVVSRGHVSLILSVFYAVGIPISVAITALLVEEFFPHSRFSPSYGEHDCWLNGPMAVALYFVTPCCIICCVNAIFVGLTLRSLRRQRTSISEFKKSNAITAVTDTAIVVKIILLVGITWLLGLVAALVNHEWLWIIFTIINASLGFMISVVLVFNKRVYYAVQKKCLCYNNESNTVVSTQIPRH